VKKEPGWYTDPYFRNRERYWENRWTDRVRRVGAGPPALQSAPGAGLQSGDAAANDIGAVAGAETVGTAGFAQQSDGQVQSATLAVSYRMDGQGDIAQDDAPTGVTKFVPEDDTLVVPTAAGVDDGTGPRAASAEVDTLVVPIVARDPRRAADLATSTEQLIGWEPRATQVRAAAGSPPQFRRRRGVIGTALVLVVVLILALVLVTRRGGGEHADGGRAEASAGDSATAGSAPNADGTQSKARTGSSSAASNIATAARRSAATKTVLASVSVTSADTSQPSPQDIAATGAFLLGSGEGPLDVTLSSASKQDQKFLFPGSGKTAYVNVSDSPVPGKTWVVASTTDLPTLGPDSDLTTLIAMMGNPGLLINELSGPSLIVTSSGSSTISGTPVSRYEVNFASGLTVSSAAGYGIHTSEEVDVGPNGLVRQIVMPGPQVTVGGHSIQENIVVAFSGYRNPLVVQLPPFGQMISLSQYLTRPSG
jgi:hypothetical protein